jgi:hypothetical protein
MPAQRATPPPPGHDQQNARSPTGVLRPAGIVRLLDVDPDLGRDLPDQLKASATRQAIAHLHSLARGPWHPAQDPTINQAHYGLLVVNEAGWV